MCKSSVAAAKPRTSAADTRYGWWFAEPLAGLANRKTLRYEVVPRTIWTFEQLQGTLGVLVNIRMTVVALKDGGLWVHAPVAPTVECVRLLRELEASYGDVKYIVLPTYAVEHKVYLGPFARQFKTAEVWVSPYQWSYPVNLPLGWLGLFPRRASILPPSASDVPWGAELDHAILGPISLGLGPFVEVAFNHKASGTLIVTDSLVKISSKPMEICQVDPYPLLYHARSNAEQPITDTAQERIRGWQKTVLFAFYLRPVPVDLVKTIPTFQNWFKAPTFPKVDAFFPFEWNGDEWKKAFDRIEGKLLVPPILQNFVLNRRGGPQQVTDWVDKIARWKFKRVIPAHFSAPVDVTPQQFRNCFRFLQEDGRAQAVASGGRASLLANIWPKMGMNKSGMKGGALPEADMAYLKAFDNFFVKQGLSRPREKDPIQ
eukprot:CAMPEP_0198223474 /NCGR_PEP_ID=MMETSP1445-20131203/92679_1 /TAXON_ID=36898 /ORGANISM="Pyramimonas sp., Strain CCMP2087" /LENGTH=429 /DNA_ID=CAMNT_0043902317 /DNA_START=170 /DNA_END=1459 /DNA_ORIENTATION=+